MPSLIIHGHFYQPPRENPWTGIIEEQPSAAPFHDWNERIHAECYRPNSAVVVTFPNGETSALNNYEHISFNFGPTLLSWLDQHHRSTYNRIIAADRQSVTARAGHGNAIAQAYGHAILPLCNERDLRTQIRWGLADFRYRFGRDAEAMWLPETACNERVLNALIDEGMRYVILAPHQARSRSANEPGSPRAQRAWGGGSARDKAATRGLNKIEADVLDPSIPYQYSNRDGDGSIAVFLYDGSTSRAIAFEHLLKSSRDLVDAFVRSVDNRPMLNVATDGETYGHHFKFGDLCLAHTLTNEAPARGFTVTNYSAYLDQHPPEVEVEINDGPAGEGSSWSCPHGVGRWHRDCGCRTGGEPDWNQAWRKPLRAALDFLRDENIDLFEATRGKLFTFPWLARDESVSLILDPLRSREQFLFEHAGRSMSSDERWRALSYLELERMLLLMYTSCGWFFNDISGIETIQILKYAARALDLMGQLGLPSVRDQFLAILGEVKSNRPEQGTGADIFRRLVEPANPRSQGAESRLVGTATG